MLREGIRDLRERKDAAISLCDKDLDGEEANPGTQTVVSAGKPENKESPAKGRVGFAGLMIQGIATSIDALSVGFTISEYHFAMALTEALIIGAVTFIICMTGVKLGRQLGTRLAGKATILGGAILIFIGIEIFLKGVL